MSVSRPSKRHGRRKRVNAMGRRGSWSCAFTQVFPPSVVISTHSILPLPDHARPVSSYKPGPGRVCPPDGKVITDFASMRYVKIRALPSGIRSEYFEVSSLAMYAWSVGLRLRSHFTLVLPSHP